MSVPLHAAPMSGADRHLARLATVLIGRVRSVPCPSAPHPVAARPRFVASAWVSAPRRRVFTLSWSPRSPLLSSVRSQPEHRRLQPRRQSLETVVDTLPSRATLLSTPRR
jgi:hypothetical protein